MCIASACDSGGGASSDPGPLVDNASWVPSEMGEELFGTPPQDSECQLNPESCLEFPWPEGGCVTFEPGSTCIAAFVPECFDAYTVLAVYTRMPDDRIPLCNWLTLEQPSLRDIRAGDRIEVRTYHFKLTAPVAGEARMSLAIGEEIAFEERILIPRDGQFLSNTWTATKSYPAGTPVLWHVDNHGTNEYLLIEVNVL
jgi:hypothetical protein